MQILKFAMLATLVLSASAARAVDIVIPVEHDVMTSGFFTGTNLVRGYAGDGRPVHRVTTNQPFGTPGAETVYMTFNYDFQSLSTPVARAILRVDSQSGGFGADATVDDPFLISAHGVTANPLTSITDDTNAAGPISWTSFYANNILPAAPAARTAVSGFGTIEFDVTDLVNSWISGGNPVHALALTGKNDISGVEFLHGITNDHETVGVSHSLVLSPVPEPSSVVLGAMAVIGLGLAAWRRRRAATLA
jgi:MYXO-CTERM domain-containing protein